jgi:hypothetical protein
MVPLLPLVFLINPALWRNVCPLASVAAGPDGTRPGNTPPAFGASRATEVGLVILVLLIPLRPVGLEESALASSGLVLALAVGAFVERRNPRKSGFCNGWCPVLAVERLYGQVKLVPVANARCVGCTACTPDGCIDLSVRAAQAQLLGQGRSTREWLFSPWGLFAAAFPGVIGAFFLFDSLPSYGGPEAYPVAHAYGWTVAGGVASWSLTWLAVRITGASWRTTTLLIGGVAALLYLWVALPGVATVWGAGPAAGWALRACGAGLVGVWIATGLGRGRATAPPRPGGTRS